MTESALHQGTEPASVRTTHPHGILVLVFGILGVLGFSVLAPAAWILGSRALKQGQTENIQFDNQGFLVAGRILGIIGTALLAVAILVVLVVVTVVAAPDTDLSAVIYLSCVLAALMIIAISISGKHG